jgi:hypothetical protein
VCVWRQVWQLEELVQIVQGSEQEVKALLQDMHAVEVDGELLLALSCPCNTHRSFP